MINQRTLAGDFTIGGVGIHAGTWSLVRVGPAPCDTGIVFRCASSRRTVPARLNHAAGYQYSTSLESEGFAVGTIEHLMAALRAFGIDNAVVEIMGNEVPIMDGSARAWTDAIKACGVISQDQPSRRIRITKPMRTKDSRSWCSLSPVDGFDFSMSYDLMYDHPDIGHQSLSMVLDSEIFDKQLADARTFGFINDLPRIRELGLAQGACTSNTVVFSSTGLINREALRWPDEPVRHKILDAIGDLFLVGYPIIGHFHGHLSGHRQNQELVEVLLNNPESWCFE